MSIDKAAKPNSKKPPKREQDVNVNANKILISNHFATELAETTTPSRNLALAINGKVSAAPTSVPRVLPALPKIVGFDIAFDKSRVRIQRLVDRSVKARQYYSDAHSAYSKVRYEGAHTSLKNKSQTYTVEGANSDLRHYIPPLHRRSKSFFRSLETAKAVLKIFVNAFNLFAVAKNSYPLLKNASLLTNFLQLSYQNTRSSHG